MILYIMKKTIKQSWSTIPPISTKQTITSHLISLNMKKPQNNTEYDVGNPGPGLGQEQICDGFRPANWIIRYEYNSTT